MTATDPRPRNIYQDALDAQGACNLGALVHGFDRVVTALQLEMRTNGQETEWLNKHPAVVLFVEQLRHLSGNGETYSAAYAECETKAREAGTVYRVSYMDHGRASETGMYFKRAECEETLRSFRSNGKAWLQESTDDGRTWRTIDP